MSATARKPLFERLKTGLEECVAHARGEATPLKTTLIPEAPPEIDAVAVAALRAAAAMSQSTFAGVLNVSAKTVQSWEQGARVPSMASRRLLQVFSQRPDAVCEAAGVEAVRLDGVRVVATSDGRRKLVVKGKKPARATK